MESPTPSTNPTTASTIKIAARSKNGLQVYGGGPTFLPDLLQQENALSFEFSQDGSLIVFITQTYVGIYETETGKKKIEIQRSNVTQTHLSPKNSYLVTFQRFFADNPVPNLLVWDVKTGEIISSLIQKNFVRENWPTIKWTGDEMFAAQMVSNSIHFFTGSNVGKTILRSIKQTRIDAFAFAPISQTSSTSSSSALYRIATFSGEAKSQPGAIQIYEYPRVESPVARKNCFKSQSADLLWNSTGDSLLAMTHTEEDTSGKSYYGEDNLYFYSVGSGSFQNITLGKEGPIHDVKWSPQGNEFVAIFGYTPAKVTLFGKDCKPKAEFGTLPRNTVMWSPSGHLLLIAGFGNLQGDIDIWDPKTLKKLGGMNAHCSSHCEWSPDSEYILTAVLSPRIRVDNCFKVWSYQGDLIRKEDANELYQVQWMPALPGKYPSKKPVFTKKVAEVSKTVAPAPAPAKYRHPNFSGQADTHRVDITTAQRVSAKKSNAAPKSKNSALEESLNLPPGITLKVKKPKAKKVAPAPSADSPVAPAAKASPKAAPEKEADPQKKAKTLLKKLHQIEKLKQEQKEGRILKGDQLTKLKSEDALRKEIEALGVTFNPSSTSSTNTGDE